MNYTQKECVQGFKIRWFIENCCEIKLPNGKTIVIDPMLVKEPGENPNMWQKAYCSGFGVDTLEGCDYVVITHIHGDHITSLKEVYDKFQPTILVNGYSALELATRFDIPPGAMIPVSDGGVYHFEDCTIHALAGRHTRPVSMKPHSEALKFSDDPLEQQHMTIGSLYNNNYLLELPGNLRIAVDSGFNEPYLSQWEQYKPNLVLRHVERNVDYFRDSFVQIMQRTNAQYILPLCQQVVPENTITVTAAVNAALAEKGLPGRMFAPQPGRWYNITMGCTME